MKIALLTEFIILYVNNVLFVHIFRHNRFVHLPWNHRSQQKNFLWFLNGFPSFCSPLFLLVASGDFPTFYSHLGLCKSNAKTVYDEWQNKQRH